MPRPAHWPDSSEYIGSADSAELDPFEAHARRESRSGAAVLVLAFGPAAERVAGGLVTMLRSRGRGASSRTHPDPQPSSVLLREQMKETTWTLVLVTTSTGDWTASHLDPMLDAIEHADHVVGRRRTGRWSSLVRLCKSLPWRIRYAVPVSDLDSPCRIHRVEALSALYLEAKGPGLPLEILAKATYLGQLIDEVAVPSITSANRPGSSKPDRAWARRPRMVVRVSERSS